MTRNFKPILSQEELKRLFSYDPASGLLYWRKRPLSDFSGPHAARMCATWNGKHEGKRAFTAVGSSGYHEGMINGVKLYAHRVIWKLVHGEDPLFIDHINHVRSDNRISNLRNGSFRDNLRNRTLMRNNTSGAYGVCWHAQAGGWRAVISADDGRVIHLGTFSEKREAQIARAAAEKALGYHPNHGREGFALDEFGEVRHD